MRNGEERNRLSPPQALRAADISHIAAALV
jgi:hypothetical protein